MPYASNRQSAFLHIQHPRLAARWDREGSKVEGVDIDEMPHFEDRTSGAGADLQVEKWPISSEDKRTIMRLLKTTDVVGELPGGAWQVFGKDGTTHQASAGDVKGMPKLPSVWSKFFVHETMVRPTGGEFEDGDADFMRVLAAIIGDQGDLDDRDCEDSPDFGGAEDGT